MTDKDIQYYGIYSEALLKTEELILGELNRIISAVTEENEHSPAEHIRSRIKSAESMREKLQRRGSSEVDAETALRLMSDAVGVRVVTHFVGDVYAVYDRIKQSPCWKVIQSKDYISNPKPNGYRSLHVILEIPIDSPELKSVQAEIQLRTIAMDCWASLEHQMKYKKDIKNAPLIIDELRRCADEMASTDLTMQTIRGMIQQND